MGYTSSNYTDDHTLVYIAHPISGDIIGNITKVLAIARQLHVEENVIPLTPYISYLLYLDDHSEKERMMGVIGDKAQIARAAERIEIFGPKISTGIKYEALFGKQLVKPITLRNPELINDLGEVLNGYKFTVRPFELKREYMDSVECNLAGLVNNARWLEKVTRFAQLYDTRRT
jgi:hypothetical protein